MARCLIVANQTLGGEELDLAVRDSMSRDITQFDVLVPVTGVEHETTSWRGGFALGAGSTMGEGGWADDEARAALEEDARRREAAFEEARGRAQSRLQLMIAKIVSAGGEAEGALGDPDPAAAASDALERRSYDEVIVSTLPSGLSRWLKMDLPSRIARMTDAPVITVEAKPDP